MIYLDYTATTPPDGEILDLYNRISKDFFGNSSSINRLGLKSDYMINRCKEEICDTLNINNSDIIFTSNATEANNIAILGYLKKYKSGKIITSKIEHPSVFEVYKHLESIGFNVIYLDCDKKGIINLETLKKEIDKETLLVSIMWVNNIVGAVEPIEEVISILKDYPKCKLHVDMVQGICKIKPRFDFNDIDFLTISAHKIYGPKGIGALIYKKNLEISGIMYGSSAQNGLKPGTMDVALVCCLTKAIKKYYPLTLDHYEYVKKLRDLLVDGIKEIDAIYINLIGESPYILSISIPKYNGETLIHKLEEKEIYVSTGSSCASKLKKPEKTILEITEDEKLATSMIRISLSHLTKESEIVEVINAIKEITK